MRDAIATIHRFLRTLQRRSALLGILELGSLWASLFFALVLVAAGLGALHVSHPALVALFWLLLFAVPAGWWVRVTLPRHLQVRGPRAAARHLDRTIPATEDMVLSAVELAHGPHVPPEFSRPLINAVVEDAADRIRFLPASRVMPARFLAPWLITLTCTAATLAVTSRIAPERFAESLQAFFSPPTPPVVAQPLPPADRHTQEGPELGDITLVLEFPAYLERRTRVLENVNGDIFAPLGTQVSLTARCAVEADRASIIVDDGPPASATVDEAGRIAATFVVQQEGSYRVHLYPPGRDTPVVTRAYPIRVEVDEAPTVDLFGLESRTEITPNDAVPFSYRAEDDHGLTRIDLVVSGPSGTARKTLRKVAPGKDWDEARVTWYPAEWDLGAEGSVTLWLEVWDNDTVSGPKVGTSARYEMVLATPDRQHARVLEAKDALKEALITLLGDVLLQHHEDTETRSPRAYEAELEQLSEDTRRVLTAFDEVLTLMDADPLEEVTVMRATEALLEDLQDGWESLAPLLKKRAAGDPESYTGPGKRKIRQTRAQYIETVERAVLSMESFANLQRMESVRAQGQSLRKTGDSLRDMLEALKRSGDRPDVETLLAKVNEMERQLAQLAVKFSSLDRTSAEWFQNPTGETRELQDLMDQIRQAIQQGNMDEALELLEKYLETTEKVLAALDEMQRQEFEGLRDEVVKDMEGVIEGLREIERRQKTLLSDTRATREALRRQAGLTDEYLDDLVQGALRRVEEIRKAVDRSEAALKATGVPATSSQERRTRELRDQLGTLEAALQARDLLQAHREAVETLRGSRVMEAGLNILETRLRADLAVPKEHARAAVNASEALVRDLDGLLDRMERLQQLGATQAQGLAARQRSLHEQSKAVGERLAGYAQDSPLIPARWGQRANQAARSMEAATEKLESGELAGGAGDQQVALKQINDLLQELEGAREAIAQRMRGGGGKRETLRFMPNMRGRAGEREFWGGREMRVGRVDISKEFEAPEEYRREIMEGMQGEAPARYKQLNRDYYEKLVH